MRVPIVGDEASLAEATQAGLRHEAIAADIALDGDTALIQWRDGRAMATDSRRPYARRLQAAARHSGIVRCHLHPTPAHAGEG